jgi:hypothetical protein
LRGKVLRNKFKLKRKGGKVFYLRVKVLRNEFKLKRKGGKVFYLRGKVLLEYSDALTFPIKKLPQT